MSQVVSPNSPPSIAVIGAGIIGMSVAWRLSELGWRVVVYEKKTIGGEASWAGAGMLSPGGEVEGPSQLASLAIESRRLYSRFVQDLQKTSGLSIDYQETGALELAYSPDERNALEAKAQHQSEIGITSKALTTAEVEAFWPRVRTDGLIAARFYPGDAVVNPREVLVALAAACQCFDVVTRQNSPVLHIAISTDSVVLETKDGRCPYEAAVIAAGAWSSKIQLDGCPPLPPAEPVKGHLIGYQQPEQTCNTIVRHRDIYLLQRTSGLLIVGASMEHVGFDRSVQPDIQRWLAERAAFVFPHLAETTPSESWIGFRPGLTLQLGAWHSNRLYLAYGHYRNGILLAPVTAQVISSEISANLRPH